MKLINDISTYAANAPMPPTTTAIADNTIPKMVPFRNSWQKRQPLVKGDIRDEVDQRYQHVRGQRAHAAYNHRHRGQHQHPAVGAEIRQVFLNSLIRRTVAGRNCRGCAIPLHKRRHRIYRNTIYVNLSESETL